VAGQTLTWSSINSLVFHPASAKRSTPLANRGDSEADIADFCLSDVTHGRGEHSLPSSFLFGSEPRAQERPAQIAIALELVQQRVQQVYRGARPVADGEWCVAMSAGSSRVFRWRPERGRLAWQAW
jgi:hypothetical protein